MINDRVSTFLTQLGRKKSFMQRSLLIYFGEPHQSQMNSSPEAIVITGHTGLESLRSPDTKRQGFKFVCDRSHQPPLDTPPDQQQLAARAKEIPASATELATTNTSRLFDD